MTRINCIPVEMLLDQHLFAEYREIFRVSTLAKPLLNYGSYCLGSGHVKFFYNKGLYLQQRAEQLYVECRDRGYNVQYWQYKLHAKGLNNNWEPTKEDKITCLFRLTEKQVQQADFYKLRGKIVKSTHYLEILNATRNSSSNNS